MRILTILKYRRIDLYLGEGEATRSFCQNCRWQVTPKHAYTLDPTESELADYAAVQA